MDVAMSAYRVFGGLMAAVPIAALIALNYQFGTDFFGRGAEHPWLYGVLLASFSTSSIISLFAYADARRSSDNGRALLSALVLVTSVAASATASFITMAAKQDAIIREGESNAAVTETAAAIRRQIADLPRHRSVQTVIAEQELRERDERAGRKQFDQPRRIALMNELDAARRAAELDRKLKEVPAPQTTNASAAVSWLASFVGHATATVGMSVMALFIVAAELVASVGLYCALGGHGVPPSNGGQRVSVAPQEVVEKPIAAPVQLRVVPSSPEKEAATAEGGPVLEFIRQRLTPAPGSTVTFAEIKAAWDAWAGDRAGTINLGAELKTAGIPKVNLTNRRVGYVGIALAS